MDEYKEIDIVFVREELTVYTNDEYENQYGLPPQAFINDWN